MKGSKQDLNTCISRLRFFFFLLINGIILNLLCVWIPSKSAKGGVALIHGSHHSIPVWWQPLQFHRRGQTIYGPAGCQIHGQKQNTYPPPPPPSPHFYSKCPAWKTCVPPGLQKLYILPVAWGGEKSLKVSWDQKPIRQVIILPSAILILKNLWHFWTTREEIWAISSAIKWKNVITTWTWLKQ